jgi:hypothetical protein
MVLNGFWWLVEVTILSLLRAAAKIAGAFGSAATLKFYGLDNFIDISFFSSPTTSTPWNRSQLLPVADASTFGSADETLVNRRSTHSSIPRSSSLHSMALQTPQSPHRHASGPGV